MDGSLHDRGSTKSQRERIVENWMLTTLEDGGIARLDELHIDRIDSDWKGKDRWFSGGLEAYQIAVMLRDMNSLDVSVVLAFSLEAHSEAMGIDFETAEQLAAQFDWTPPSLYLFRRGGEVGVQVERLLAKGDNIVRNTELTQLVTEKLIEGHCRSNAAITSNPNPKGLTNILRDHPKAANEGHLKTGQRR